MKKQVAIAVLLTIAGLGFRLFLALHLPNDEPDDGRLYARIALNVLDHRSYSIETEEPYSPTLIRAPGYPLFIAGVYAVFGHDNNRAVRGFQAVLDSITCWVIALLALAWAPAAWPRRKRRRLLLIALGMAVTCPFPAIYVATILTETCTILLATACALAATLALKSESIKWSAVWWAAAGVFGGAATLFRPDSGFFVAAIGGTLVVVGFYQAIAGRRGSDERASHAITRTLLCGVALSLAFAAALAPWTIRNARVFGLFQPIAPAQANMPGEFVPRGYIQWLRTWVDDVRYTESLEWSLDQNPIHIEDVPDYAFDSADQRERVAELLDRYNNPPGANAQPTPPDEVKASQNHDSITDSTSPEDDTSEETDLSEDNADESDTAEEPRPQVEMTPDVDAGFAEIARERIARQPLRYYVIVPLKRASALWLDTHSQYYPFQGELLPLADLDTDLHQQYWLPLFTLLTLLYTVLGLGGALVMWADAASRRWLLLMGLLIIPRFAFLTSMENPEPRYVVEFFAFVIAAGSIAVVALLDRLSSPTSKARAR